MYIIILSDYYTDIYTKHLDLTTLDFVENEWSRWCADDNRRSQD